MLDAGLAHGQLDVVIDGESFAAGCSNTQECRTQQCKAQAAAEPSRHDRLLDILLLAELFSQALHDQVGLRGHTTGAGEASGVKSPLHFQNAFAILADLRFFGHPE